MALRQKAAETLTVSSSALGFTAANLDGNTVIVKCQHRAGGKIFSLVGTPVAGGGSGNQQMSIGAEWEVTGPYDIANFKMIKQTGESDATIDCQFYRTGI